MSPLLVALGLVIYGAAMAAVGIEHERRQARRELWRANTVDELIAAQRRRDLLTDEDYL